MKRTFLISTIWLFAIFLLGPQLVIAEESSPRPKQQVKPILLDPWYGGQENGPRIGSKYAKEITLQATQKVRELLEADGLTVLLTRTGDNIVSLEQRVMIGRSRDVKLHLAIKVSKAQSECIKIYAASPPVKHTQKENQAYISEDFKEKLDEIVTDLIADSIREESLTLGGLIRNKIKDRHVVSCIELLRGTDYLLRNVHQPAVMIDYRISTRSDWKTALDKIASLIAESIKERYEQGTSKEKEVI